jgi:hypothetical protein
MPFPPRTFAHVRSIDACLLSLYARRGCNTAFRILNPKPKTLNPLYVRKRAAIWLPESAVWMARQTKSEHAVAAVF